MGIEIYEPKQNKIPSYLKPGEMLGLLSAPSYFPLKNVKMEL